MFSVVFLFGGLASAANFVTVVPWGDNALRVRVSNTEADFEVATPGALYHQTGPGGDGADTTPPPGLNPGDMVESGVLRARVGSEGLLSFERVDTGETVVSEIGRDFTGGATAVFGLPDRVYGFGEHQYGFLDNVGHAFDMEYCLEYSKSHGGEVCMPFVLGYGLKETSMTYGLLWNLPAYGAASFGVGTEEVEGVEGEHHRRALKKLGPVWSRMPQSDVSNMTWQAVEWQQYDYVVYVPEVSPASSPEAAGWDILRQFANTTTGPEPPSMPENVLGYWHSRNRYSSQEMFESTMVQFYERHIPVCIAVIDYHSWVHMGDERFDPSAWPSPGSMVKNLTAMDMQILLSVWPFSAVGSVTYDTLQSRDLVVNDATTGQPLAWPDPNCDTPKCWLYDATNDSARAYFWSEVKQGYFDYGIQHFWLDASEPENINGPPSTAKYSIGTTQKAGMMYPFWHTRTIYDGLQQSGVTDVATLTRSAWAGQARFAAITWSGDTQSTFESLQVTVQASLSSQISGIPWWTCDTGGYSGGNPADPTFRNLIVRWFQFSLTSPIFRQHGDRPTEPWLLGNESYTLVVDLINTREALRPYVRDTLANVTLGKPVNRPLLFDFPTDSVAANITDTFMFGDAFLSKPVTTANATSASVYLPTLPSSASWMHCYSEAKYPGGQFYNISAPLYTFPLFVRTDRLNLLHETTFCNP